METALRDHVLSDILKDSVNMQITGCVQGFSKKAECQPCGEAGDMTGYFMMIWGLRRE